MGRVEDNQFDKVKEFIHRVELDRDFLEKLAEATHEVFCDELRAKGYKYGSKTSEKKREHSSLGSYTELPEEEREQNRRNVRDIPNKLASVGYIMLPACGGGTPGQFQKDEVEKLAKTEHERWMQQKLDAGWRPWKKTIKSRKLHRDLVPWEELPEQEKEKDRVLVNNIPRILAKAGYVIVKLS